MNADIFKLTGDTLCSVHKEPDEDEEMIFEELYKELMAADTRNTRSQRGRGVQVGGGKGLIIRRPSTSTGSGLQAYTRRGSSSSHPIHHDGREPSFDDEGNLLSEPDSDSAPFLPYESFSENSLDEHSTEDDFSDDGSDSSL